MFAGVGAGGQLAFSRGLYQEVGVRNQRFQLRADLFDGVIDKRLLTGKLLQRGLEIASAEFGDAGHGLFLDRNMALDHFIYALGHRPVSVFEFLHWMSPALCASDMRAISWVKPLRASMHWFKLFLMVLKSPL